MPSLYSRLAMLFMKNKAVVNKSHHIINEPVSIVLLISIESLTLFDLLCFSLCFMITFNLKTKIKSILYSIVSACVNYYMINSV